MAASLKWDWTPQRTVVFPGSWIKAVHPVIGIQHLLQMSWAKAVKGAASIWEKDYVEYQKIVASSL